MSLPAKERYLNYISVLDVAGPEANVFSKDFLSACRSFAPPLTPFREFLSNAPATDDLSRIQYLDMKTYLSGDILPKVDRMSMAVSLEVRAPLLDHVVAEWACQLSPRWKIQRGEQKYLLKKVAEKLGVPRSVLYRQKQGFAVPVRQWFRGKWKDDLLGILLEPTTLHRGYFDENGVRALMNEHIRGRRDRSRELWLLLIFELWQRNFVAKVGKSNAREADFLVLPKPRVNGEHLTGEMQSSGSLSNQEKTARKLNIV
jgi:asparagine synthase (glutamine-hydrolysing)